VFKPSNNPKIDELTKSYTERRINLSNLNPITLEDGKGCAWCTKKLTGRQLKWCSGECSAFAWAWANPQKEGGLHILLVRQDFKCNSCQFDYMPYIEDSLKYLNKSHKTVDPAKIREKISERLMKILKYKVPSDRLPEVDHIVPIYKGGAALDLDNLNCLCYTCHKTKTSKDLSGKRKK